MNSVSAFTVTIGPTRHQRSVSSSTTTLFDTPTISENEFYRPLQTDRILKTSSGKQRRMREYTTTVEATLEECQALAKRFELRDLRTLSADLSLRAPERSNAGTVLTVKVVGTIQAHLTQTCVRTNEDFDVEVELPLVAIVKPVSMSQMLGTSMDEDDQERGNKPKNKASPKIHNSNQISNLNDVMDLQEMLNRMDDEEEDSLVEDEAIYSLATGILDVGELVAQTFWLNLDPYPKKPGTGPIEIEISG